MLINEINGKKVIIKIDNTNQTGEFFYYKNLDNLFIAELPIPLLCSFN